MQSRQGFSSPTISWIGNSAVAKAAAACEKGRCHSEGLLAPVRNVFVLLSSTPYGGFPKLGVPLLGVPIIRTIVFWGLYWGPLILENYHIDSRL